MNFRSMCFSTIPRISTGPASAIPTGIGTGTSSKPTRARWNRSSSRTPRASPSTRSNCPPISISGTSSAPRRAIRRSTWMSGTWRTSTRRNRKCAPSISFTRSSRNSASRRRCRKPGEPPGRLFAQQRASLLIAPSELAASLPKFPYAFTLLPGDMARASLARVNGWAVTAQSSQTEAARALAGYLACQPVHAGWSSVQKPADDTSPDAICYEALGQALVPRIEPKTARMAQFLDQQINLLARNSQQTTDELYARIQTEYQSDTSPPPIEGRPAPGRRTKAKPEGGSRPATARAVIF